MTKSITIILVCFFAIPSAFSADEEYSRLNRAGAFFLTGNGYSRISIGVATNNPELLKLAISFQEAVFKLSGARPSIENIPPFFQSGRQDVMWNMIYFVNEQRNDRVQSPYTISWEFLQPGYSINCKKRLRITYSSIADAKEALDAILMKIQVAPPTKLDPAERKKKRLYLPTKTPEKNRGVVVRQLMQQKRDKPDKPLHPAAR